HWCFEMNIDERIKSLSKVLNNLISAKSIMYNEWSPKLYSKELQGSAGVYHFYEESGKGIRSLYIGKAGVGKGGNWDLYQRLKQHFQPSQENTYLGKFAKSKSLSGEEALELLNGSQVKLQWVSFKPTSNLEKKLMNIECFCKAVLDPKYTDE
ncbi:TPA: hypothetical protein ACPJ2S_004811, partial [Vibrio alginolyticus]|uniref:hypothetical protein n=2 Tax=Vibrionaceae TaxID=641 RepID=UPI002FF2D920